MAPPAGFLEPDAEATGSAGGIAKRGPHGTIRGSVVEVVFQGPERERRVVRGVMMSRVCYFTGKRTKSGRQYARRGKAKYLGGVGVKVTGRTKRKFKPNIQKVRAVIDGRVVRVQASAKAIRNGCIVKPPKRTYKPTAEAAVG